MSTRVRNTNALLGIFETHYRTLTDIDLSANRTFSYLYRVTIFILLFRTEGIYIIKATYDRRRQRAEKIYVYLAVEGKLDWIGNWMLIFNNLQQAWKYHSS